MKKRLFLTALITAPLIALYGASPFLIFVKLDSSYWFKIVSLITLEVGIIWLVHIYFELKYPKQKNYIRFIYTYLVSTILRLPFLFIFPVFKYVLPQLVEKYLAYPILTSFALNIIIMVIIKAVVNGYKIAENEKQLQALKLQNTEAQKQVLMQQLQPHFLFNALSTLKSLITENPTQAEDYSLKLSDFLRYTVQSQNQELATLANELHFVTDYLNLQKIRFGAAFLSRIEVSELYLQKKIPVLALQVLVENIFKHNYFTEKKPLHFTITAKDDLLVVWNEKTSIKLSEKNNTGLKNLNARYQLICNEGIEILNNENEFQVTIPLL